MTKKEAMKNLEKIPGIGKSISEDLYNMVIRKISDLKNKNPEKLYDKSNAFENRKQDRCLLYVFRSAVYFASNEKHEPELLKWWNWKDSHLKNKWN